jgi:hypothetical protein
MRICKQMKKINMKKRQGENMTCSRNERAKCNKNESGSTTVLVVAILPVVFLLMGLSIDVGRIIAAKAELYKASDVAAREIAKEINVREASQTGQIIRGVDDADAGEWVDKNLDGLCGAELLDVKVVNSEVYVEVESRARVPLLFSGLINKRSTTIRATGLGRLKVYPISLD